MLKTSTIIHLPNGRNFCYAEYGNLLGTPVVLIHGTPLCRTMWEEFSDVAAQKNIRIIAPDRPGYGYSDYNPNDNLDGFPSDITTLLDHLGIEKCTIGGVSGGGPATLMCALKIPQRLEKVVIISGVGPYLEDATGNMNANKMFYKLGQRFPWLLSFNNYILSTKILEKNPAKFLRMATAKMKGDDRLMLEDTEFVDRLAAVYKEACIHQKRTVRQNSLNYDMMHTINWKIPLTEIKKKVHILYGEDDRSVGDQCKYLAEKIPNTETYLYPELGHFVGYRRKEDLFELLA